MVKTFRIKQDLALHVNVPRFFDREARYPLLMVSSQVLDGTVPPQPPCAARRVAPPTPPLMSSHPSSPPALYPVTTTSPDLHFPGSQFLDSQLSHTPHPVLTSTPLPLTLSLPEPGHLSQTPPTREWTDDELFFLASSSLFITLLTLKILSIGDRLHNRAA